jgi:hypothetical protein
LKAIASVKRSLNGDRSLGPDGSTNLHLNERLATIDQKISHVETELGRMSAKVDEVHAILLQAKGVRWAVIAVSGLVGCIAITSFPKAKAVTTVRRTMAQPAKPATYRRGLEPLRSGMNRS